MTRISTKIKRKTKTEVEWSSRGFDNPFQLTVLRDYLDNKKLSELQGYMKKICE